MRRREFLTTAALATLAGCIGGFDLTGKLYGWNRRVSSNKFVNWIVFFAFLVVPVYVLTLLGDAILFNSIEFWTGHNPIASGPRTRRFVSNGRTFTATADGDRLRIEGDGVLVELERAGDAVRILDDGRLLATARPGADGSLVLVDAAGTRRIDAAEVERGARRIAERARPRL